MRSSSLHLSPSVHAWSDSLLWGLQFSSSLHFTDLKGSVVGWVSVAHSHLDGSLNTDQGSVLTGHSLSSSLPCFLQPSSSWPATSWSSSCLRQDIQIKALLVYGTSEYLLQWNYLCSPGHCWRETTCWLCRLQPQRRATLPSAGRLHWTHAASTWAARRPPGAGWGSHCRYREGEGSSK